VADSSDTVVGDTAGLLVGQPVSQSGLTGGYPIQMMMGFQGGGRVGGGGSGQVIGQFFYLGQAGGALDAEQNFLNLTNRWLWLSGGIAAIIAVGLAVVTDRLSMSPYPPLTVNPKLEYRNRKKSKSRAPNLKIWLF
jgi:two-component system OmpR family sensor kinase/two-component system sensor histidine kinase BaeS